MSENIKKETPADPIDWIEGFIAGKEKLTEEELETLRKKIASVHETTDKSPEKSYLKG